MRNAKSVFSRGVILVIGLVLLTGGFTVLAKTENGKKLLGFRPDVKITLTANVERDNKLKAIDAKTIVSPGEKIHWNVVSKNEGNANAEGFKTVVKVPEGTSFVSGTARGDASANVTYSIDGGKSFTEQPMVDEKQIDGTVKKVPALVSTYTNIQFQWESSLAAGNYLAAEYQVQVK
jgi:uncharacterized repeat protein (TIGR01451 family)